MNIQCHLTQKTQRGTIAETSDVLRSIVEGTVPYKASSTATEVQVSKYNSILALGDMLYLISDDENQKAEYLKAAGINAEEWDTVLTRDEIAAVNRQHFGISQTMKKEKQLLTKQEQTQQVGYGIQKTELLIKI